MVCWRLAALALLAISGCKFDSRGVGPIYFDLGGAHDVGPVADRGRVESGTDSADASRDAPSPDPDLAVPDGGDPLCGWPFDPAHFDPCADPLTPSPALLLASGSFSYDTDAATFDPVPPTGQPTNGVYHGTRVIWVEGLKIEAAATLRVVGSLPLMVVSTDKILVAGVIDVSSSRFTGDSLPGAGASTDPSHCPVPPQPGVPCDRHGASGGGGGGFGSSGGQGDSGGVGHDCGDIDDDGKPRTAGGGALAVPLTAIRAGCAGAPGSSTTEGGAVFDDRGEGGPGGGAIQLVARGTLIVSGVIDAGGGGGGPGSAHRASGGGGGSGGWIGLEAGELQIVGSATLAANGGGGGGGCDNSAASAGEDALAAEEAAAGGDASGNGGDGHDGGYGTTGPDSADEDVERGGGGGGGGGGLIFVHSAGKLLIDSNATISPPQT